MTATIAMEIARRGWPHLLASGVRAVPVAGGRLTTSPLWRLDTHDRSYALRGWDSDQVRRAKTAQDFAAQVSDLPTVPVPVPAAISNPAGDRLLPFGDFIWELAPWLPGEATLAVEPSEGKFVAACRALARLHRRAAQIPCSQATCAVERHLAQLSQVEQRLADGEFAPAEEFEWGCAWPSSGLSLEQALLSGVARARQEIQLLRSESFHQHYVWGDAWHNNFLFSGSEVVGLVDFATVRVDTPAVDLARLLGSTADFGRVWWPWGLDAYAAERPLTSQERRAALALIDSGTVLSLANWFRWLSVERRPFPDPLAAIQRVRHFAARLRQLLDLDRENAQM